MPSQGDELMDSVTWVTEGYCGGRKSASTPCEAQDGAGQLRDVGRNPHHDEEKFPEQETCAKSSQFGRSKTFSLGEPQKLGSFSTTLGVQNIVAWKIKGNFWT